MAPSVPLGSNAAAGAPVAGRQSTPAPDRTFIAFDRDAAYHETRRDLPHRDQEGATAFVTFRLADSVPGDLLESWHREKATFLENHPKPWDQATREEFQRRFPQRIESWLDQGSGSCFLATPAVATLVERALRHFDGSRYVLDAWVIMPNHVHVLVKPLPGHRLEHILHSWKSFTAKEINKLSDRNGQVWQHESFDHLVRSPQQLEHLRQYIRDNPKKAGITDGFVAGFGCGLAWPPSSHEHPAATGGHEHPACDPVAPSVPLGGLEENSAREAPAATVEARETPAATSSARGTLAATVPKVNLIVIATRQEKGDYRAQISRHLALAVTAAEHWTSEDECRVAGVDLAGYEEASTRAHYFREEFTAVHRCGLALTVHAGENDEAEGIWRAVFDLNARRLGHALHLRDSPELMRSVADRRVCVEMCPYANLQIKGFAMPASGGPNHPASDSVPASVPLGGLEENSARGTPAATLSARGTPAATAGREHPASDPVLPSVPLALAEDPTRETPASTARYPLLDYLRAGIRVTVNTDNIGISAASLTENFLLLARLCPGITRLDLLRLIRHSIDAAFLSPSARLDLLRRIRIPGAP